MPDRIAWSSTPMITIPVYQPRCPHCGHVGFIHVNSANNGDNSTTEKAICKSCSHPFRICRERSSEPDVFTWWPEYDS
jgi:hypothetical protein